MRGSGNRTERESECETENAEEINLNRNCSGRAIFILAKAQSKDVNAQYCKS